MLCSLLESILNMALSFEGSQSTDKDSCQACKGEEEAGWLASFTTLLAPLW